MSFTLDEGATLAPLEEEPRGTTYTTSVIALEAPNTLLAANDSSIFRSVDSGCSWSFVGQADGDFVELVPGADDRAYGYSPHRSDIFVVTEQGITPIRGPGAEEVRGLAVLRGEPGRLRLMDARGAVFASDDDGASWTRVGAAPLPAETLVYRVAFAGPAMDRVVVGVTGGAYASADGGRTWNQAKGLSDTWANIFSVAFSPADEQVVWAEGLDLGVESGLDGRHLYVSNDRGAFFEVVLTASADVTLPNGVPMLPHPTDPDILYFTWGSSFQGLGTKIYRVSAREKSVTWTSNPYDRIEALTASPADPGLLYLGLSSEQID